MKIKNVNSSTCKKCLELSLPVNMMIRFAKQVNPKYNIYSRTGLSEGMPISNQSAAARIVADMIEDGYFVDFVENLIRIDAQGYMGHKYNLKGLDDVVKGLIKEGYIFDTVSGQFFENQRERISQNWGRLQEGDERKMTLLRLDIAGNSELVKNNSPSDIKKAYEDLRGIVSRSVTNRFGRLWSWEGDAALAVFLFGAKETMAVCAGMEILHELFFYNRIRNPLNSSLDIRLGAHVGQVIYSNSEFERLNNDTVKQTTLLEKMAAKNTLCVSYNLYISMDSKVLNLLGGEKSGRGFKYRLYSMGLEK